MALKMHLFHRSYHDPKNSMHELNLIKLTNTSKSKNNSLLRTIRQNKVVTFEIVNKLFHFFSYFYLTFLNVNFPTKWQNHMFQSYIISKSYEIQMYYRITWKIITRRHRENTQDNFSRLR